MVVDDNIIESKKLALKNKINTCESDMRDLISVHRELSNITLSEDPIIDKGTGVEMTESRRQEIYDSSIVRADALL